MAESSIPGLDALIQNITTQVKTNADKLAFDMANKFTGSNINALNTALLTAEVAENQVERELLEHIGAQTTESQKNYYRTINTRKKILFSMIFSQNILQKETLLILVLIF